MRVEYVPRIPAGHTKLRLANPYEYPADVHLEADGARRNLRFTIPAGQSEPIVVPPGTTRVVSAVYPDAPTFWSFDPAHGAPTLPRSAGAGSVAVRVTGAEGHELPSFRLVLSPWSVGRWSVVYERNAPRLFATYATIRGPDSLVVGDGDALRYEVSAGGYRTVKGDWPRGGRLELRLRGRQ